MAKLLNIYNISYNEKGEKYQQLDQEGKDKVKNIVEQIAELSGILGRKRDERAPFQQAKDDALVKVRAIFEKLKEEKRKIPSRLQPLPQLRENDEKAFFPLEEKKGK